MVQQRPASCGLPTFGYSTLELSVIFSQIHAPCDRDVLLSALEGVILLDPQLQQDFASDEFEIRYELISISLCMVGFALSGLTLIAITLTLVLNSVLSKSQQIKGHRALLEHCDIGGVLS